MGYTMAEWSNETLAGLVVSALEGGSNYWYRLEDYSGKTYLATIDDIEAGRPWELVIADMLSVEADEDPHNPPTYTVNAEAADRALEIMAKRFPRHFADVITESYDADTGDVFLQLATMGKLVYG